MIPRSYNIMKSLGGKRQRYNRLQQLFGLILVLSCWQLGVIYMLGHSSSSFLPVKEQQQLEVSFFNTIQWRHRNYAAHPVTAQESAFLDAHYNNSGIRVAVCHPTIHEETNLTAFFRFVSYYRLLGFNHIFSWYLPGVVNLTGFDVLEQLPYVTLIPGGGSRESWYNQESIQRECFKSEKYAKNYDWAMPLDADEFLMLDRFESIHSFLARHSNYSYVSIGKWMYSSKHATNMTNDSGFGLDRYPWTPGSYCYQRPGDEMCPGWKGRCKVLAKPSIHYDVGTHGDKVNGNGIHLPASQVHIKEWQFLHETEEEKGTVELKHNNSIYFQKDEPTYFARESHPINKNDEVEYFYDAKLHDWLLYVAKGCPNITSSKTP